MSVRVRFCPSPTGFLHVGGVRTALYNWLYARGRGGTCVLRIEDTDTDREQIGAVEQIQRSLDWLGLDFDESPAQGGPHAPYLQSQRGAYYAELAARLVADGHAYHCYQTPEELEGARALARETDDPASPTRAHRDLSAQAEAEFVAAGRSPAIRLRMPVEGVTTIVDEVRGEISFDHRLLGDHVLVRPDGRPTYQFANPADDLAAGITHVIRGEDLLPSTPRQKALVEALGGTFPVTAHLPMILGPDKKRLSKRHGAASVEEFRALGYLPHAIVNYLALVGWSYDGSTEIMTRDELVARFSLDRVNPAPGVFDHQKLAWMNGVHLRDLSTADYASALRAHLSDAGSPLAGAALEPIVPLVQEKLAALGEFEQFAGFLFHPVVYDEEAFAKIATAGASLPVLRDTRAALAALGDLTPETVEAALRAVAERLELKPREAFAAPRVAVTGRLVSPGLFESIALLGRDATLARIDALLARLADEVVVISD